MKHIITFCCAVLLSALDVQAQPLHLTQTECRKMAVEHSEDLRKADNTLKQAEYDRKIARSAYLPSLDASALGIYALPDMDLMGMKLIMRGSYLAGINLTQPVYAGGSIIAANKLAAIGEEAAQEQRRLTRMDVLEQADNAYWTYIAVGRQVRMLDSYHAQMDTLYTQVEAAVAVGMATENDLLRIDAERTEIAYQLQKARNGEDLCRMSLCQITGNDLDTDIIPVDTTFNIPVPVLADADISTRPEMHLLEKQISAAEQQIKMVRSEMLPTIGFTANYMYYGNIKFDSYEFREGTGMFMLAVKIPIFSWGQGRNKVRKAQVDLNNARLDLKKNTRLMDIELRQAVNNVTEGYSMIEVARTGLRQAEENIRVTRNRYDKSMAPLSDMLDAQSQWQAAYSNLIEAQTQYMMYYTHYLKVSGRLE